MICDPCFIKINPWYPPTTSYTIKAWNYPWNDRIMVLCEYTYPPHPKHFYFTIREVWGVSGWPIFIKSIHHVHFSPVTCSNPKIPHQIPRNPSCINTHTLHVYFTTREVWDGWWPTFIKMNPPSPLFTSDMIKP